jgi:hypothetical protein
VSEEDQAMNESRRLVAGVFVRLSPCHLVRLLAAAVLLLLAGSLWGQPSSPHVGFVYPAGGRQGTTFEAKLGGQYLDGATRVEVSGSGVEAKILGQTRPMTQKEKDDLRRRIQELQKKKTLTDSDRKEIETNRQKLAEAEAAIPPTPVLAEIVTVEVTIAADAAPGGRELRLAAATGMSNPMVFEIGQLPEVSQKKVLIDPEGTERRRPRRNAGVKVKEKAKPVEGEVKVTLPAVLNSQLMPTEVDRYRFAALKGQQLVFVTRARGLIPYLADAVPGWFQVVLTLYDDEGKEVAASGSFHYDQDPVLAYQVARDGDYVLEVKDGLYRGREDFVYRLDAGELPFITNIFPLGGHANTRTTVQLEGWNLPKKSLTLEPKEMKPGILQLSVRNKDLLSNRVPFAVTALPEALEKEPNNTPETAQRITLPIIVNGRISEPGDVDVFQIQGIARQTIIAEVQARRLRSPLDSVLKLTDKTGKVLAYNDDQEDRGQGLHTHHADSLLRVTLPADGTYYLHLTDAQRQGSAAHAYRLRVSAPMPDFELRATPSSINSPPGSTVSLTVYALRKDGFSGDINVSFKYSPKDFLLAGAKVPANQDEVRVTLQVPATARPIPVHLALEGWAFIGGRRVTHMVTPAEDMMQAFAYHHLVPANDMLITVSGKARARFPARLLARGPVRISAGKSAVVNFAFPRGISTDRIRLVLSDPPEGITLKKAVVTNEGASLLLLTDAEKVRPGLRANLIVEAYPETGKKGSGKTTAVPLGTLPAIPFEILRSRR